MSHTIQSLLDSSTSSEGSAPPARPPPALGSDAKPKTTAPRPRRSGGSSTSSSATSTPRREAAAAPTTTVGGGASAIEAQRLQRKKESEERRRKQEELKQRMMNALGPQALASVAASATTSTTTGPVAAAAGGDAPKAAPAPQTITTSTGQTVKMLSADSLLASSDDSSVLQSALRAANQQLNQSQEGIQAGTPTKPPLGRRPGAGEYGIMVADRGTQTATEQSSQTDPDPHAVLCPHCYEGYFGHAAPHQAMCPHYPVASPRAAPTPAAGGSLAAGYSAYGQPQRAVLSTPMHFATAAADTAAWRLQIETIQRTVDALIFKYNLPAIPPAS